MKKTTYHTFLDRIRQKILGEALEALGNQDDPSRFQRLKAICSDPKIQKRLELLTGLYGLESKTEKESFDIWLAMLWSGQARIPAPLWAVRKFESIGDARLFDDDVIGLEKAFGFRAGQGKTPELLGRARHVQYDALCREVWTLSLLDYKPTEACKMVARRFQQQHVNHYIHELRTVKLVEPFAEKLRQRWYRWRKENAGWTLRAEPNRRAWLATHKDEYLKQFPPT